MGWVNIFERDGVKWAAPCPGVAVQEATESRVVIRATTPEGRAYLGQAGVDDWTHKPLTRLVFTFVTDEAEIVPIPRAGLEVDIPRESLFLGDEYLGTTTQSDFDDHGQSWEPPKHG
ncbi:hypothetical protein ACRDU6_27435 [Mycolicibacterium sp. ELW1]|uniref:hypothetical protein n=1 Tax=Mycobacteriaceae TaxID=1762 RepID=UPI0011ECC9D4|nr:hypothetical protein [Mycobacterium sp. ELW1]QEN15928.1 hypothetical protein D3H54_23955 [Mycobacterium sp. ELW1]